MDDKEKNKSSEKKDSQNKDDGTVRIESLGFDIEYLDD